MDDDSMEMEIIEELANGFSADDAKIQSFPDNPVYVDGVIQWSVTHPKCEILVAAANIAYDDIGMTEEELSREIEIFIFAKNRRGADGVMAICGKIRRLLTSCIIQGCQLRPSHQDYIFYDNSYWCYGQKFKYQSNYVLGE